MRLSEQELSTVKQYFENEQLTVGSLEDDLVDHCCSGIEQLMQTAGHDFDMAFALMRQRLVPNGAMEIEEDLKYLENYKPQKTMKKFVFASGYVSTLCLVLGIVMISLSYMKRQRVQLDREHSQLEIQVIASTADKENHEALDKLFTNHSINQSTKDLAALDEAMSLFSLGQLLILSAIGLFSLTLLPYQFYRKYQRSLVDFSGV